ncbi:MAG: hypothetical protein M2R45_04414 [Verrucomicrobia subdivision 3 bacterium]|nr:hypothetical protein [Limisphaerales bacterium]
MLKHQLIHPQINEILGRAGHHSIILIADGNYPASTKKGPNAQVISLNLSPGIVTCSQVLEVILSAIPIDAVNTMGIPADDPYAQEGAPPVWEDYRRILKDASASLKLGCHLNQGPYQRGSQDGFLLAVTGWYDGEFRDLTRVVCGEKTLRWDLDHDLVAHEAVLRASGMLVD